LLKLVSERCEYPRLIQTLKQSISKDFFIFKQLI
jgi:hypothetical protein